MKGGGTKVGGRPAAPARKSGSVELLERRVQALQLLHETGRQLVSLLAIEDLLPEMVDQLRRVVGVEIVSIMLLDDGDRKTLRIAAASGLPGDVVANTRVPLGEGISGQCASRGEPILVRDMSKHPEFAPSRYASQYTTQSLLSVPLRIGDRVLGVVNLNNKLSGEPLDDDDLALVSTFCSQAALAIENSRLYGNLEAEVRRVTAELQRSNEDLRRMQEFTESIITQMSSGVLVLDLEGCVTKLNAAGATLLGVTPIDRNASGAVAGAASAPTLSALFGADEARQLLQQPENAPSHERREMLVHRPDGAEILIGFSTSLLVETGGAGGADGRHAGHIVIFRDLTHVKKMEAEVVRLDRMASLGVLGAGIAHEIRNPLAAIRFNIDFVREEAGDRPELEVVRKNVDRLDDLVRKLLRFARPQAPSFTQQPIEPRIEAVLALVGQQAHAAHVTLATHFDRSLPDVVIDGQQAEQVVLNVVLNGIQAMPSGGAIRLSTRLASRGGLRFGELSIADDGDGLPEGVAAQIFDPFYTTRREGTGLGLAVSRRIMDVHGGYIELAPPDPARRGTTFRIGFPLAPRRS